MKLFVKNMVCNRCIMIVEDELEKMGYHITAISLGEVEIEEELSASEEKELNQHLKSFGFELIDDKKSRMITMVKSSIIELVHQNNSMLQINLSDYLREKVHYDYTYLSNLFSEMEGVTIEKYYIAQRIERVKELLVYDELSLSEIAYKLNYSSVAHLSSQFKKVTGLTPGFFRKMKGNRRTPLDEV